MKQNLQEKNTKYTLRFAKLRCDVAEIRDGFTHGNVSISRKTPFHFVRSMLFEEKFSILANADNFYYLINVQAKARLNHSQVATNDCFMTLSMYECVSIAAQAEYFS